MATPKELALRDLERRAVDGRALGHAHRQLRSHVPGGAAAEGVVQPDRLLVGAAGLEESDADRGLAYSYAFFSARHLGAGQYYLMTVKDARGRSFDGGSTYRLRVPADAPITQYWSATAYDRATHALIRNTAWSSRSSQTPGIEKNSDGSIDVYFGPKPPAGKKANWVPTRSKGSFEVLFRVYGPEKAFFERKWKLPDIEKAK